MSKYSVFAIEDERHHAIRAIPQQRLPPEAYAPDWYSPRVWKADRMSILFSTGVGPKCPDCGTVLRMIDDRPEKERWACPVAIEAQRRGILGEPGRKHKAVLVYKRRVA